MSVQSHGLFQIRRLQPYDIEAVLRIERSAYRFPWNERIFRDCLRVGYRCFAVADPAGDIMGYSLLSIAVDEAHVLNLCVAEPHRRQGVAQLLLERLLREARAACARAVLLEVRPSNSAARALYDAYGFKHIATRRNYYPVDGGREDAYLLSRRLDLLLK